MLNKKIVLERLKQVIDPELGVNIVDLGLVYDIKVKSEKLKGKSVENKIYIMMTLTTPGCPLAPVIESLARRALGGLEGIDTKRDVTIELTFDPPWTMEMMTEEVRAELGFD